MASFNATRLQIARQRRRLSPYDLAELLGVKRVDVVRWEKGTAEPPEQVIKRLPALLKFPLQWFYMCDVEMLTWHTLN